MVQCLHRQNYLQFCEGRLACASRRPLCPALYRRGWAGVPLHQDKRRRIDQHVASYTEAVDSAEAQPRTSLTRNGADEKHLPGGVKEGARAHALAHAAGDASTCWSACKLSNGFMCARLLGMEWIQDKVSEMWRQRPTCAGYSWVRRQLVRSCMLMPARQRLP